MFLAQPHVLFIVTIVALSLGLMLVRPRGIAEVWWVGAGAALLIVPGLLPWRLALQAVGKGTDVYLFLTGMMLLSELGRVFGVFEWVAGRAVRSAQGRPARLFLLFYAVGTLTTIFLSNDATAVVLTPAVLAAVRRARVEPRPHLFACAMIANAASFVLPISNPANLVVFREGMPNLARWLLAFSAPSALAIGVTWLVLRLYFRDDLHGAIEPEEPAPKIALEPAGRLVLAGFAVVAAVLLAASAFGRDLGLPTCLAALAIAGVLCASQRKNPVALLGEISWSTLLLVAALFIQVEAVESLGVLHVTAAALRWCGSLPVLPGAELAGLAVGIANNAVNNLPLGLLAGAAVAAAHPAAVLKDAVLLGIDLGPNLSVTSSLATLLWLIALRKEKLDISAWEFLKAGAIAMPLAMMAAVAGLVCVHLAGLL